MIILIHNNIDNNQKCVAFPKLICMFCKIILKLCPLQAVKENQMLEKQFLKLIKCPSTSNISIIHHNGVFYCINSILTFIVQLSFYLRCSSLVMITS